MLMCAAMLASLLVGCSDKEAEETTTESTAEAESEKMLVIADNGQSEYSIYYAAELATGGTNAATLVNTMAKQITAATGAKLEVASDSFYSDALADKPAILVGNTKFAESAEAAARLPKIRDYYLGIIGNKLVIYSASAEACMTAVQYFMNNIIAVQKTQGKTLTFSSSDEFTYNDNYGIDSVKLLDTELSEYSFVVAKNADVNEKYFASRLRYWLMKEYGVLLDIANDTSPAGEHEIVVGHTSRVTAEALDENEYSVRASGGRLELSANGYAAYDELYSYVTNTLIPAGNSAKHTVAETVTTVDATASYEKRTDSTLDGVGDVRAMYYNMYGWSGYSFDTRMQMQVELIRTYAPDIVGLQEVTTNAKGSILYSGLRELGYKEVTVSTGGKNNYTPLFYKEDKLTLKTSGWYLYDGTNDSNSKSVTWAVFETTDGKQFIAMSTHFYYTSDTEGSTTRVYEAQQLVQLISTIRQNSTYADLPLIVGGDFNCRLGTDPHTVLSDGGLSNAWETAVDKNNIDGKHGHFEYNDTYGIYENVKIPTDTFGDSIDHAFVSEGVTVDSFRTLCNEYVMVASDHSPLLVDISF